MKKVFAIIILMVLVAGMVTSCSQSPGQASDYRWLIIESPNTGRYYEIAVRDAGYKGYAAMSEVTQAEYEAYIAGLQE